MSVKYGLMAILANGPRHGYALTTIFDEAVGSKVHLNRGQVYSTCSRLMRDGLISETSVGAPGRVVYELTDEGRSAVSEWLKHPADSFGAGQDDLATKVLLGRISDAGDVSAILRVQRESTMSTLQAHRSQQEAGDGDIAELLQLDRLVYLAEAELRWIDRAEERLSNKNSEYQR